MKKLLLLISIIAISFQSTMAMEEIDAYIEKGMCQFIENKGQWPDEVKFSARLDGINVWIKSNSITYDFFKYSRKSINGHVVEMDFVDSKSMGIYKNGLISKNYNYFIGSDKSKWSSNVKAYEEVFLAEVWPGIDIKLYFDDGSMRYDFILKPGANPEDIALNFEGEKFLINLAEELVIGTSIGDVYHNGLFAYQKNGNNKDEIDCQFAKNSSGEISFKIGQYDKSRELIIDPRVYSRNIGGIISTETPVGLEAGQSIYLDGEIVYVAGATNSMDYPTKSGAYQTDYNGGKADVIVFKLRADGSVEENTIIGGEKFEAGMKVFYDGTGVYVGGTTKSIDFPVTSGAYDESFNQDPEHDDSDVFLLKLNNDLSDLIYSTFIGTGLSDQCYGLAVDGSGNAIITGLTESGDFPTTDGAYSTTFSGVADVFITKMNSTGTDIIYSTFFGGTEYDLANGMQMDSDGNIYITGGTKSTDFPTTTGAASSTHNGGDYDSFVAKFANGGSSLLYSSYIGGSAEDIAVDIAIDQNSDVYITGETNSEDFPVTNGAYSETKNTGKDAFIAKFNHAATSIDYASYIGGTLDDIPTGIAVNSNGEAFVSGNTYSEDFPITIGAFDDVFNGVPNLADDFSDWGDQFNAGGDGFLLKFSSDATTLMYSSFTDGYKVDNDDKEFIITYDVALGANGMVYTTGIGEVTIEANVSKFAIQLTIDDIADAEEGNLTEFCPFTEFTVPYTAHIDFNAGNKFILEVSDDDFATSEILAEVEATESGEFVTSFDFGFETDRPGYRFRVRSTNPELISDENIYDFTLLRTVFPEITGNSAVCELTTETYSVNTPSGVSNLWTVEGGEILGDSEAQSIEVKWSDESQGKLSITQTLDENGCSRTVDMDITIRKPDYEYAETLDFGEIVRDAGTTKTLPYVITNKSINIDPALYASYEFTGDAGPQYGIGIQPGEEIVLDDSLELDVQCDISAADTGRFTGNMNIIIDPCGYSIDVPVEVYVTELHFDKPDTALFSNVGVGESSTFSFTFTNSGTATFTIETITVAFPFTVVSTDPPLPAELEPGESITINLEATAAMAGYNNSMINVNLSSPTNDVVEVPVSIYGADPNLEIIPVDFGTVLIGENDSDSIFLKNIGNVPIIIDEINQVDVPLDFSINTDIGLKTIEPGEEREISIVFSSQTIGQREGNVVIRWHYDFGQGRVDDEMTISFRAYGAEPGDLAFNKEKLEFPSVPIGEESNPLSVTLSNDGGAPVNIEDIRINPYTYDDRFIIVDKESHVGELAAGGSITIDIKFKPTSNRLLNAELLIISSVDLDPLPISGTGAEIVDMQFSETSIDFGNVPPGQSSEPHEIDMTNNGNSPVNITDISIYPEELDGVFSIVNENDVVGPITQDQTKTIQVIFSPSDPGNYEGQILFSADGVAIEPIDLKGTGAGDELIVLSTNYMGETDVNSELTNNVKILNNSGNNDKIIKVWVDKASEFSVDTELSGRDFANGQEIEFMITFKPLIEGNRGDILWVETENLGRNRFVIVGKALPNNTGLVVKSYDFGKVAVCDDEPRQYAKVDIKNFSDSPITIDQLVIANDDDNEFRLEIDASNPIVIPAGGNWPDSVEVSFKPEYVANREADLQAKFEGSVIASGKLFGYGSPIKIYDTDFGNVRVGSKALSSAKLKNCSSLFLTIEYMTIIEDDEAFSLSSSLDVNQKSITLGPNDEFAIPAYCTPTTPDELNGIIEAWVVDDGSESRFSAQGAMLANAKTPSVDDIVSVMKLEVTPDHAAPGEEVVIRCRLKKEGVDTQPFSQNMFAQGTKQFEATIRFNMNLLAPRNLSGDVTADRTTWLRRLNIPGTFDGSNAILFEMPCQVMLYDTTETEIIFEQFTWENSDVYVENIENVKFTVDICESGGKRLVYNKNEVGNIIIQSISPNPSDGEISVDFSISATTDVSVMILDAFGQEIKSIDGFKAYKGNNYLSADCSDLPSGMYQLVIKSAGSVAREKILLIK